MAGNSKAGPARIGWNVSESDGLDADSGWVSNPQMISTRGSPFGLDCSPRSNIFSLSLFPVTIVLTQAGIV